MRIELPELTRKKIRNVMGRDFDTHSINIGGVRHGLKNHGVKGKKLSEKSIPLSQEDAELIPYIMTAPDRVTKGSDDFSRESIRFYKTLSNGYVVVVEKEKNNSPDDMETINIWAEQPTNVADAYSRLNYPGATSKNVTISGIDAAKIRKDAENAIAQDEILQEKTSNHDSATNTEYLKTSKGEVYGFVKDGKIYIDPSLMNPNTPLHEYTHLFDKAVQKKNPKLWARGKEVMKELPLWKEVENDPAYSDIKDDEDRDRADRSDRSNGSDTAVAEGGRVGEKETKTATSEGPGAVSGTASSDSLNPSGEVRLSHSYSTQTDLVAKLRQNFKEIAQKVKKFINGGYSLKKGCKLRLQPFFVVSFAYIKQNAYLYGGKQKEE